MERVAVLLLVVTLMLVAVESRFRPRTGELAQLRRELESFYEHRRVAEGECDSMVGDIVFVLDESGSIYGPDFTKQLEFVIKSIEDFELEVNKTHIGVMTFSDDPIIHFQLTDHHSFDDLKGAIEQIGQRRGSTYTDIALDTMWQEMFSPEYSRSWVPHIAVVVTDGESHYPDSTAEAADRARAEDITMFAIGVGTKYSRDELEAIADSPPEKYVFNVSSYSLLDSIAEDVMTAACQVTTPVPTQQPSIEKCSARGPVDVLFALPDQAGVEDTDQALEMVASVASLMEMGEEQSLVGITPRNCDDIADEIRLGDNDMLQGFLTSLEQRRLTGTETWRHLRHMHTVGMTPGYGSRENSARFGVLVIDNKSADLTQALRQADRAKEAGIHLVTIAVGGYVDQDEVQQIASSPEDVFTVEDYTKLNDLTDALIERFCYVILHG